MSLKAFFMVFQSLSAAWTFESASFFNQTPAKYFPCPWFILFNMVTDLVLSSLKVEGLIEKYASMASIHLMASSDSLEKCSGRAALISEVFVVVDIGFAGGGLMVVEKRNGVVIGTTDDMVVTRGVTGGRGLVTGLLG